MEQIFQQLFNQQRQHGGGGGLGGARRPRTLQVGMEVQVRPEVSAIHNASRACGIDASNDERRARCAGKEGMIVDVDPRDQSVKLRPVWVV